jgi:two-component system, OmpR family, phosphate regulon sensor histidine kinase PhoR
MLRFDKIAFATWLPLHSGYEYKDADTNIYYMKEGRLRLLIAFSLLSIAGLMAIQGYWIFDAIRIKENHFRQTVNQAITGAVLRIEQNALVTVNNQSDTPKGTIPGRITSSDSLHMIGADVVTDAGVQPPGASSQKPYQQIISQILDSALITVETDTSPVPGDQVSDPWKGDQAAYPAIPGGDSILSEISRRLDEHTTFSRTRKYLETWIENQSDQFGSASADNLIDSAEIYSMIREELEKVGLKLDFIMGIYLPYSGNLLYCDTLTYRPLLLETGFVFNLFPSFNLSKPVYLIIHFPSEKHYLFSRLGMVLILSTLLTIMLIWSFFFITRSIYRQKKLGEMKNDFINNMTHEFKTPVSTISLACEALRDQDMDKSPAAVENYLKIIDEENRRLGKLAEQILQTAVIDKGHLYLYFESVNLHQLIGQIIEKYKPVVGQQSGLITAKLLAADPSVKGDRSHLYNMISNLVDNAVKYSGNRLEIEILTRDQKDTVTISIQDKGVGISKANQKRIFEKLYRVPTGNVHNVKGFGLGLSYVKYIVERHEGVIRVESELNKGSTFIITLPRQPINK